MLRPRDNPPNPWHSTSIEWATSVEWLGEPPADPRLQVFEETARSALSENDSPDVGFRFGVNPYRGCFHACSYCYARPYHQYLDWGAGTDFERRIVVKTNVAQVLRQELARPSWNRELVCFSGVTDCYQPLEASYRLTRACLEVCLEARNPIGIVTKGVLVRRDLDLLAELARLGLVGCVYVSVTFAEAEASRRMEPSVALPEARFAAIRALADAGVPVGVSLSPIIPALNDSDVPDLLERAAAAGATRAFMTLLRLPAEVAPVFLARLREAFPDRAAHVESVLRQERGGKLNEASFGKRMGGQSPRWSVLQQLFQSRCRQLGIDTSPERHTVRRLPPRPGTQLLLPLSNGGVTQRLDSQPQSP